MSIIRKRLGNDLNITISVVNSEGTPVDFTAAYHHGVFIQKRFGRSMKMEDLSVNGAAGQISFVWKADNQYGVGDYTVLLTLRKKAEGEKDSGQSVDYAQAVYLTHHTSQSTDKTNIVKITFEID